MTGGRKRPERQAASPPRGLAEVELIHPRGDWPLDIYHRLLTMPWSGLFVLLSSAYFVFNLLFAGLYLLQDGSIANAKPHSLVDAFFFSVQTTATIGYGEMRPATLYGNLLVTAEVLLGLTVLAVATGLVFARFSRPTARVLFSAVAVVAAHDGVPTLMFRAANRRRNQILEAQVSVALLRDEVSGEGMAMRRFHDLKVERPRTPMFALSWTVMHKIDDRSPLSGETHETLLDQHAEIVVAIVGIDETVSQTIYARHSYAADEILWNRRFADILGRTEDGRRRVDYRRFHDTIELHPVAHKVKA